MYGTNARKATITLAAPSADIALALPTSGGTLALTSQIPTISYPVTSVNSKTGAVSLTASDVGALSSSTTYVSTITTSAGAHTTISSKSGAVSFNVPTKTSHLTNDSNFVTSSGVTSISTSSPISGGTITGTGTISHATSGVGSTINTAGFYKFKYDTYGHVTGVSSVTASDITGLVTIPTDENVKSTTVTTATTNYIVGSTSSSTTTGGLSKHASAVLYTTADTATNGYTQLRLGNTTVTTTAGGREGQIRLYGTTATYYVDLKAGAPSANRTITFPNATGTVALTSDLSSFVTSSGVTSITPGNGLIYGTSGSSQTAITSTGTISMATISRTNNTSTASPAHGGTFTAVDSITTDSYGRVTAVNTKTVTLPASGNTDVSVTSTTVTAASTIYLTGSSSSSTATGGLNKHGSANLYVTADSGTSGSTRLLLGNSTASGTAGAKYGYIRLYGTTAYYTDLQAGGVTANRTITFPDKGGTVALTSDIPSIPTVPTITLNGSSTTSPSFYAPTSAGTSGYYLKSSGSGAPTWAAFPSDNDTKNTAGSTDTSSKIYLIGATSQAANPQTYSHDTAYVGTDGCLYSGGSKVLTSHQTAVTSLTTTAGAHSTKSSATGAVSMAVPTKTSHLTNDSSFTTLQDVYPVGAIYISTVSTNPGTLFGFGSWDPIEGQFLLGANSTYTAGSTGGSPYLQEHTHTMSHTHTMAHTHGTGVDAAPYFLATVTTGSAGDMGVMSGSGRHYFYQSTTSSGTYWSHPQNTGGSSASNTGAASNATTSNHNQTTGNTNQGNMPPYLAVYMWKRTA